MLSKLKAWIARLFTVTLLLGVLLSTSSAQAGADLSLPFARRSTITQDYGSSHKAIDYRAAWGTPVVAARAGTVTVAHNDHPDDWHSLVPDYGNWIEIDHGDGYKTRYAHLSHSDPPPNWWTGSQAKVGASPEWKSLSWASGLR